MQIHQGQFRVEGVKRLREVGVCVIYGCLQFLPFLLGNLGVGWIMACFMKELINIRSFQYAFSQCPFGLGVDDFLI